MKYATEIIGLMECYPGRRFKMAELVRTVRPGAAGPERQRVRNGVLRVLEALRASGTVEREEPKADRGGFALYSWKVPHGHPVECQRKCHNSAGPLRP